MTAVPQMWAWIHQAVSWFKRRYSAASTGANAFYVTAHSSIPKGFETFVVPKGVVIAFKAPIGDVAYTNAHHDFAPETQWGVQTVGENQPCINHSLSFPDGELFVGLTSAWTLRRPPRYTHARVLLHGVFALPLPSWFDEFPSVRAGKTVARMKALSRERRQTATLQSVVERNGPGVYFVSCCRVIRVSDRCYRVTSDSIESNDNVCYRRRARRKPARVREVERIFESALHSMR